MSENQNKNDDNKIVSPSNEINGTTLEENKPLTKEEEIYMDGFKKGCEETRKIYQSGLPDQMKEYQKIIDEHTAEIDESLKTHKKKIRNEIENSQDCVPWVTIILLLILGSLGMYFL